MRLFARELGVDLAQVAGSHAAGASASEDAEVCQGRAFPLAGMAEVGPAATGSGGGPSNPIIPWPKVDFAARRDESKPLSRIQKISGVNLARNWAMILHVTQHDDADITELEVMSRRA